MGIATIAVETVWEGGAVGSCVGGAASKTWKRTPEEAVIANIATKAMTRSLLIDMARKTPSARDSGRLQAVTAELPAAKRRADMRVEDNSAALQAAGAAANTIEVVGPKPRRVSEARRRSRARVNRDETVPGGQPS